MQFPSAHNGLIPASAASEQLSVAAIGERIHVLQHQMDALERQMDGSRSAKQKALAERWAMAETELSALSEQALRMPARTLADVAVQVELAYAMAENMADCDTIPPAHRARVEQLRAVLASVGMLVMDDATERLGVRAVGSSVDARA